MAVISNTAAHVNPDFASSYSVHTLWINNDGTDFNITRTGTGRILTIASGGRIVVTNGGTTVIAPDLAISGTVTADLGQATLRVDGMYRASGSSDPTLVVKTESGGLLQFSGGMTNTAGNPRGVILAGNGSVLIDSAMVNGATDALRFTLGAAYTGTATLSGNSTYSGGTTISGGTLLVGHDNGLGSGLITLSGGAIGAVGGARTITNTLTGNATRFVGAEDLTLGGTWTTVSGDADVTIANTAGVIKFTNTVTHVIGGSNNRTLTINTTNAASKIVFSGLVTNTATSTSNMTKRGPGELEIAATGIGAWNGITTVTGGTFRVNGLLPTSANAVKVFSNATLAGSGIINRPVAINHGGILAPGNSIGTLTVSNLTLSGAVA